jgi:hypothetical protein
LQLGLREVARRASGARVEGSVDANARGGDRARIRGNRIVASGSGGSFTIGPLAS